MLIRSLKLYSLRPICSSALRGREWLADGWWIRDQKADRHPRTPEERKAAAKKYGLRESDYEPYPADAGYGNYPQLGPINYDVKDPYEDWSYPNIRRNFSEPVPREFIAITPDRYTHTVTHDENPLWSIIRFFIPIVGVMTMFYLIEVVLPHPVVAVKPKQYPYDYHLAVPVRDPKNYPLVNYTFEPED